MTNPFLFIGTDSLLHLTGRDVPLTFYGQTVELTDEQAQMARANRIPLLSPDEQQAVGFTPDDLDAIRKGAITPDLARKQAKALDLFVEKVIAGTAAPSEPKPASTEPSSEKEA